MSPRRRGNVLLVDDDGAGGTILLDEVDYALPLGLLSQWVAGGFVERQIARMFAYRHETTKRMVESAQVD